MTGPVNPAASDPRLSVPRLTPRVSICVPNLNTLPFLAERFRTIQSQSLQDWELLVYDSYSNDGAWGYIQELESREPRMRAWQGPRAGTPGSWTPCIRAARGEYVYIATSDDTMPPNCLESLVRALDDHPECDIAHCPLKAIDGDGREDVDTAQWWSHDSAFAQSSGRLMAEPHVRLAPFDGLLHLLGGSVYVSITQLLIRRSLFDRIGLFESTWGSIGDFNWSMRAGLVANAVHVPGTWGGWRVHAGQATAGVGLESVEHERRVDAMIDDAIRGCEEWLAPAVRRQLPSWLRQAKELRAFTRETSRLRHEPFARRSGRVAGQLLTGSAPAREYVVSRLCGRLPTDWVRRRLEEVGQGPSLLPATGGTTPADDGDRHELHPAGAVHSAGTGHSIGPAPAGAAHSAGASASRSLENV